MKIISKVISRNEFISRKNGVIPSLSDEWMIPKTQLNCGGGESYVFGTYQSAVAKIVELGISPSLLEYKAEFVYQDHNYGLIVSDIIIPDNIASNITDYTDIYVNIPDGEGGYYDLFDTGSTYHYKYVNGRPTRKIVNGTKEIKILTYTTLNKWYNFFKKYKKAIKNYGSAIELYNEEYPVKNSDNEKIYSDLDALFNARGGNDMYNWIIDYCMPHDENKAPKDEIDYATNSASYVIPILITNCKDDLGETTIFSSKWKAGVDYHNRVGTGLGTVVNEPYIKDYNGIVEHLEETYIINSNTTKGYKQNEKNLENEFKQDDWTNYTDWRIANYPEEFITHTEDGDCVNTYAYSPINGSIIYNSGDKDTCISIDYTEDDFIVVNGEYIKVIDGEYVIPGFDNDCVANIKLKKNIKLPVIKDGVLKYAELNGKKFYAVKKDEHTEVIYFTKKSNCYDKGSIIESGKYILYNGTLTLTNNNIVSLVDDYGSATYLVFDGHFNYNGKIFYIKGRKIYKDATNSISKDDLDELKWESFTIDSSNKKVTICYKLENKSANFITGFTDSKLDLLRRRKINTDELGNELPGYFDSSLLDIIDGYAITQDTCDSSGDCSKPIVVQFSANNSLSINGSHYNMPYDQCVLDILYRVGEVSEIEFQKKLSDGTNLYNGNYLESIEFYQLDENGKKINSSFVTTNDSRPYIKKYLTEGEIYYNPEKILYCDITYYIGATLEYDEENFVYKLSNGRHKGVKHVDTLTVTKSIGTFYMSDNSIFIFVYYELRGNMSGEHLDDFKDNQLTNMSYFEMQIMTHCNDGEEFNTNYWENNNGLISSPVFRTEYNLFSSIRQNVKSDIYIDRGINAAFERHLKIEEVHTNDALENFGNGYFKIINY